MSYELTLDGDIIDRNNLVETKFTDVHPLIISASRETDIPAFYSDWLFSRFDIGFSFWKNPYNNKRCQRVFFDKCGGFIFWTKDPIKLLAISDKIDSYHKHWYAQITLNNYEIEGFEPNVPPLSDRISSFIEISRKYGPDKVIWRFDPILVSDTLSVSMVINRIENLFHLISPYTKQLVFSFIDISYKNVKINLKKNSTIRELTDSEKIEVLRYFSTITNDIIVRACSCYDYSKYGIIPGKCIDNKIFETIAEGDTDFLANLRLLKKDKGQRGRCNCIESKDIGEYSTCMHLCKYCYANRSESIVKRHYKMHYDAILQGKDLPYIVPNQYQV